MWEVGVFPSLKARLYLVNFDSAPMHLLHLFLAIGVFRKVADIKPIFGLNLDFEDKGLIGS